MEEPTRAWARMLDLETTAEVWSEDDLSAMWRHQLAAPLRRELESVLGAMGGRAGGCGEQRAPTPTAETFRELLIGVAAPNELFDAAKRFARASGESGALPAVLATGLYFAVIAAALRAGVRISSLSDAELQDGFKWTAAQGWMDAETREILESAEVKFRAAK